MRGQREGAKGQDRINPARRGFQHLVCPVEHIRIIALASDKDVESCTAGERIRGGSTGEEVVARSTVQARRAQDRSSDDICLSRASDAELIQGAPRLELIAR